MRPSAKIGAVLLVILLIIIPARRLRAQFAVFDPVQTAASAIDAINQLFETMEECDWIGDQWDEFNKMKTWFNNNFPYYSDQPTFDADGYVVDNSTLTNAAEMMRDVKKGMQDAANIIPIEANVA